MSFGSTITRLGTTGSSMLSGAGNIATAAGATGLINGSGGQAIGNLNSALSQGIADQANIAASQVNASTQQMAIGAAQQEANSTLHMAENAVATAVKFQNKMSDDAKEAI